MKIIMKIKKIILNRIKKVVEFIELENTIKKYSNLEKVIYFQTPEHGNLGDQAIAIAGKKIIEDKYPNKLIIEFSFDEYRRNKNKIVNLINSKDTIYIHGGGNFGNLYTNEENQRRDIIKTFINNKIISMPQSIFYSNNTEGEKELEISRKIIKNHKNLTIIARDDISFEFAKKEFLSANIIKAPDIVLYLEGDYENLNLEERNGVIFTLRKDKEKILTDEKIEKIERILKRNKIKYQVDDTTVNYNVDRKTRKYEVERILKKIAKSKLNITDRFHGVIFSVITNTPVIVFKSFDHKISEGVKWFKHLDNVHYLDEIDEVEEIIKKYVQVNLKEKKEFKLKAELKNMFFKL